jgi:F-type H+-transporting ATPase subunit b
VGDVLHAIGIRWQLLLMQLVGFLIVYRLVLKPFLFDRIHKVLADRAAEEERQRHAIAASKKEYDAAGARLGTRQAEIEKQAYERTQTEVRAGLKRKADHVTAALDRARDEMGVARAGLRRAREESLANLRKDVVSIALFAAGRACGRKVEEVPALAARAEREVESLLAAREAKA